LDVDDVRPLLRYSAEPPTYGETHTPWTTRGGIDEAATLVEVVLLALGFAWLGFPSIILGFLVLCGIAIFSVALLAWKNPSPPMILKNYKYSSIYMLAVMILLMTSLIV